MSDIANAYFTAAQLRPTTLSLDSGELKYVNNKLEFKGDADSSSKVLLQHLNDNSFTEVNELKARITELEQQLKQQRVSVDITDIKIDSVVKLRSGYTGVVFGIYDEIIDGINGGLAAARFFIRLDSNKGEQYNTHRKDGISYSQADYDIVEIKPPTK